MAWYEHQPFYWILKNLSPKQVTTLIVGSIIVCFLLGSFYVYLDAMESLRSNPQYAWVFYGILASVIGIFVVFFLLSFDLGFFLGLE